MWGRAMLAIVVSMACMIDAAITLAVMSTRFSGRGAASPAAGIAAASDISIWRLRPCGDSLDIRGCGCVLLLIGKTCAVLIARVDLYCRAEARIQRVRTI